MMEASLRRANAALASNLEEAIAMRKRWPYQMLCSANLGIVVVSVLSQTGNSAILGILDYPVYKYLFPVLRHMYPDSSFERRYLFYSAALLLALAIFLLLLTLDFLSIAKHISPLPVGAVTVAAFPLGCLWSRWHQTSASASYLFLLETIAAVALAVLYFYQKWLPSRSLSAVLLGAHFCLWSLISRGYADFAAMARSYGPWNHTVWILSIEVTLLPILGLVSVFAWSTYLRRSNKSLQPSAASA